MAVPTAWTDLSTTASNNPPADTEQRTTADDYFRQIHAFLKALHEGQTGGQIQFPATQNASSGANVLDDYEEGTWTPTDASGAALSLSSAGGYYIKVGRLVTFQGTATYPSTSDGSTAKIGGLPFTSAAYNQAAALGYISGGDVRTALVLAGSTTFGLYKIGAVATNANASTLEVVFGGTYLAAA